MEPKQMQAMWAELNELIEKTEDANTQALLRAMKLQMNLMNSRLAAMEHGIAQVARQIAATAQK